MWLIFFLFWRTIPLNKIITTVIQNKKDFIFCLVNICVFVVESHEKVEDNQDDDDDDDDTIDMSVFEGPVLPVTCGSDSGILHKNRFSTGVWMGMLL